MTALDALGSLNRERPAVRAILRNAPVFVLTAGILIWIATLNQVYFRPAVFLGHVQSTVPLMLLAAGEAFVIVSGEFDLSIGSLVTAVVAIAAGVGDSDGGKTWWLVPALVVLGAVVGLINGVVTTKFGVPSFITTLGMMLVLAGSIQYWTGGAVLGYMPDNMRALGRGKFTGVPLIHQMPYAVVIFVPVIALAAWLRHGTNFGHRLVAVGASPRAASLSGISVVNTRIAAFVVSGVLASIAGIILGGIVGVSPNAGNGYELQAISAAVLGGAVLGGGRGAVVPAATGAFALGALFSLLNLLGFADPIRQVFQGVIIICAVALASFNARRQKS